MIHTVEELIYEAIQVQDPDLDHIDSQEYLPRILSYAGIASLLPGVASWQGRRISVTPYFTPQETL